MKRVYETQAAINVPDLVKELYDVLDDSGTVVARRLARAAKKVRELNPSLPTDDVTTVASGAWVQMPTFVTIPFRIPAVPATLRNKLAALSPPVRNIVQYRSAGPYTASKDATITFADAKRLWFICQLMTLPGLGPAAAVALHDDATNPIRTHADVASAEQSVLRGILNTASVGPVSWRDAFPWSAARTGALWTLRPSKPLDVTSVPLPPSELRQSAARWVERSKGLALSSRAQRSARAVAVVRTLQSELIAANQASRERRHGEAIRGFEQVLKTAAVMARVAGVSITQEEHHGPSLNTLLETCREVLQNVSSDDLELCQAEFGKARVGPSQALQWFTAADLTTAKNTAMYGAGLMTRVSDGGSAFERAWEHAMSDVTATQFNTAGLATNITAPASTPLHGMSLDNRARIGENLRDASISSLRSNFASEASSADASLELASLREAFVSGSEVDGDWRPADVLTGSKQNRLPIDDSAFVGGMTVFDRFAWGSAPDGSFGQRSIAIVPINDSFSSEYKSKVLGPALEAGRVAADSFALSLHEVIDVGHFLMKLPTVYSVAIPLAISASYSAAGNLSQATLVRSNALTFADLNTLPADVSMLELVWESTGTTVPYDLAFLDQLRDVNREGDGAYKSGRYSTATEHYEEVITLCESVPELAELLAQYNEPSDVAQSERRGADLVIEYYDGPNVVAYEKTFQSTMLVAQEALYTASTASFVTAFTASTLDLVSFSDEVGRGDLEYATDVLPFPIAEKLHVESALNFDDTRKRLDFDENDIPKRGKVVWPTASTGTPVDDDLVVAEYIHAVVKLAQLAAGLNWLGFDPELVPAFSFDRLLGHARLLSGRADEYLNRAYSILLTAKNESVSEQVAAKDVQLGSLNVEVTNAQVDATAAQLQAAEAQENLVEKSFSEGLSGVKAVFTTTAALASIATVVANPGLQSLSGLAGGVNPALDVPTSYRRNKAEKEVAAANVAVAQAQVEVAKAQRNMAYATLHAAAEMLDFLLEHPLNSVSLTQLATVFEALGGAYLELANRAAWLAERAYAWETRSDSARIAMDYSDDISLEGRFAGAATLSQHLDSIEYDRLSGHQQRDQVITYTTSLVRQHPQAWYALQSGAPASFNISQEQLDLAFPGLYLHAIDRVEVEFDGILPSEGVRAVLGTTGITYVRVPNAEAYLAHTPAQALLEDWSYSGVQDPAYVLKPLNSAGLHQVLSNYTSRQGGGTLRPSEQTLAALAHMGLTANWVLQMYPTANATQPSSIADVRVTFHFRASYDASLAYAQQDALSSLGSRRSNALALASDDATSTLEAWKSGVLQARREAPTLLLPMSSEALGGMLTDRALMNVEAAFLGLRDADAKLSIRIAHRLAPFGVVATTTVDDSVDPNSEVGWGTLYSGVDQVELKKHAASHFVGRIADFGGDPGDLVPFRLSREADFPDLHAMVGTTIPGAASAGDETAVGNWTVKVLSVLDSNDDPLPAIRDDDGDEVSQQSGKLLVGSSASATFSHSAKHVHMSANVKLAGGTLQFQLNNATASLLIVDSGSPVQRAITATLSHTGGGSDSIGATGLEPDGVYRVDLYVVGDEAVLVLDGQELLRVATGSLAASDLIISGAAGAVGFEVYDVEVTRLRYDSTPLETVLLDTLDDATNWSLSGATHQSDTFTQLDLSFVSDVLLQIEFEGDVTTGTSA